ncbi:MAG TPA: lysophospholipid acyltransferase family protein [Candidatus Limnocylindria bacterium]|nr:lysophospholipid acyltransferase family protein [Candidatus Limnocylindria bacterium]
MTADARTGRRTEASVRRGAAAPAAERKRELLTYWAYRAAERLLGSLPRGLVLPVASAAGNAAYDAAGAKRALIAANLGQAMGLPADDRRVARAARRAFRNYAKYLVDVMRFPSLTDADADRLVAIDNVDILDEARAGGTGVLICTVHVGAMDMIGPGLKRAGEVLHVVADDTTYGRLYDHLKAVRAAHGFHLIGWRNLRGLFKVLRGGGNLVLFCDGGYRPGDVPVEFLGAATTFPAGPATLSARSGAPMVPVWAQRTGRDTFVARGLPLIRAASDEPAEIHRATQELADALGGVIAADPGQWYMFRPIWPQTDADRAAAAAALDRARRGEDWTKPAAS